jgi:hypothetical protein
MIEQLLTLYPITGAISLVLYFGFLVSLINEIYRMNKCEKTIPVPETCIKNAPMHEKIKCEQEWTDYYNNVRRF